MAEHFIAEPQKVTFLPFPSITSAMPRWLSGKASAWQCRRGRRHGFDPWVGKIPWRRKWQPTPVFLVGESQGQRSLVGYSAWSHKELDRAEHGHTTSFSIWEVPSFRLDRKSVLNRGKPDFPQGILLPFEDTANVTFWTLYIILVIELAMAKTGTWGGDYLLSSFGLLEMRIRGSHPVKQPWRKYPQSQSTAMKKTFSQSITTTSCKEKTAFAGCLET